MTGGARLPLLARSGRAFTDAKLSEREPGEVADPLAARGQRGQQPKSLHLQVGVEAMAPLRTLRRDDAVPALPDADPVGREAGPGHHDPHRVAWFLVVRGGRHALT